MLTLKQRLFVSIQPSAGKKAVLSVSYLTPEASPCVVSPLL